MNVPQPKPAIYADLLALPEHVVGELINGTLYQQPRPAPKHAQALSILGMSIGPPYSLGKEGPGGWWIIDEPECHLGDDILVPDIAGWLQENMLSMPDTAWFDHTPDWVCEILSPSTASKDRVIKQVVYAREGVGHLWFVDPNARTLEAYQLQSGSWLMIGAFSDSDKVAVEPFTEVPFDLGELWV